MANWQINRLPVGSEVMPTTITVTADDADIEDGNLYLYDAVGQVVYLAARGTYLDCELIADPRAAGQFADAKPA